MKTYVLGLDGGGTKTLAQAESTSGEVLFRVRGGALNLNGTAPEAVRAAVAQILRDAAAQAGEEQTLGAVCICAAGVSNPCAEQTLRAGVQDAGFTGPCMVTGDHIAALTGALGKPEGIILIAGTGSICAGRTADGREARAGGRGHLIDDEGSGYAMGRDCLRAVVEAEDGRGPQTVLTQAVLETLGVADIGGIVSFVYAPNRAKSEIAALARLLPAAIAAKDAAAAAIYERAACELARLCAAVAARLAMTGSELALAGSALQNDAYLRACFAEQLQRQCAGLTPVLPRSDAATGAAQLARTLL